MKKFNSDARTPQYAHKARHRQYRFACVDRIYVPEKVIDIQEL